jgi:hypothetical protein
MKQKLKLKRTETDFVRARDGDLHFLASVEDIAASAVSQQQRCEELKAEVTKLLEEAQKCRKLAVEEENVYQKNGDYLKRSELFSSGKVGEKFQAWTTAKQNLPSGCNM